MKNVLLEIKENIQINFDTYKMTLKGDLSCIKNPGEFIEIKLPNHYLRRPISVFEIEGNLLTLLYKVVGSGTSLLSDLKSGFLDCLIGLGNGFDISISKDPLLIGGGIGIAPLYELSKRFYKLGIKPNIILGFNTIDSVICVNEFSNYANVFITTNDGTCGLKGNPLDLLDQFKFDYYYSCGPLKMLKALKEINLNGFLSLEARMGCGFGCCMGCSIKTTSGYKRVCKEGPVFLSSEVIFDE